MNPLDILVVAFVFQAFVPLAILVREWPRLGPSWRGVYVQLTGMFIILSILTFLSRFP